MEATTEVFRAIGRREGIELYETGPRHWLVIICDKLPYVIGHRLLKRFYIYPLCNISIEGKQCCSQHTKAMHTNSPGLAYKVELGWVLLQPGPGHI